MPPTEAIRLQRRRLGLLGLGAAAAGSGLSPGPVRAQAGNWPERPVRLVVPFGPGGAIDTLSRTVANAFPAQANGQSLVVENRGGAGGTIAGAAVATARPDGSTLMMADLGANAIGHEMARLPYDPTRAFQPVCHLVNLPLVLLVPADSPAKDVAGLQKLAREKPDMPYAHPGIGYIGHLAQELMIRQLGIRMTPVPYRSGAEVVRSLLAKDTDSAFITVSTSLPFIREGKLRALAVGSKTPVPALPGVPPLAATLPDFEALVWHGIVGPAGLPAEITAAANRIFNAVIRQPEVKQSVEQVQAGEVVGGTPEEFGAFIRGQTERWVPVIRAAGIKAD
jgi:tripartite-type tricarboxylate transporter receptor subunit TctC